MFITCMTPGVRGVEWGGQGGEEWGVLGKGREERGMLGTGEAGSGERVLGRRVGKARRGVGSGRS